MSIYNELNDLQSRIIVLESKTSYSIDSLSASNILISDYVTASSQLSSSFVLADQLTSSLSNITTLSSSYIYLSGNVADNIGINFTNVTNTTNSSGVSITSELLNHYEEGTWTPQVSGSTVVGTTTYSAGGQIGRFTRIGRMVFLNGYVSWTNNTGGSGNLRIGNLPYTIANNDAESTGFLQYSNLTVPFSSIAFVQTVKNTTYLKVLSISTASANSTALALDTAATCAFSIMYEIA